MFLTGFVAGAAQRSLVNLASRVISASLLVAVAAGLIVHASSLVQLLDSDTLYPAGLYQNLFVDGYRLCSEAYNDHPGFFPDCFVYWPLLALFGLGPGTAMFAAVWFLSLMGLSYVLLRRCGLAVPSALLATLGSSLWVIIIMFHPEPEPLGVRQVFQVMYPHSHGAAILLGLALVLLVQQSANMGKRKALVLVSVLSIPTVLSVVSDKIVAVHTLAPLCLTMFLLRRRHSQSAAIWIAYCVVACILGFFFIDTLPYLGFGRFDGVYAVSKIAPSIEWGFVTDLLQLGFQYPSIGIAWLAWLGLSVVTLLREPSKSDEALTRYRLFQTYLLSVAICTLGAVAISKFWTGLLTIRYIFPLLVLPPLGVALAIATLPHRKSLFVGLGAVLLPVAVHQIMLHGHDFRWSSFRTPYPPDVECLDQLAVEHGVTRGYAEYWLARRANLFSRSGLQILPVHQRLIPYSMSLNLDAVEPPSGVEFILMPKLDEDLVRAFFGEPKAVDDCGGRVFVLDPAKSAFAKEKGSFLHLGMLELGDGAERSQDFTISSPASFQGPGIIAFGPYIALAPGKYEARCTLIFKGEGQVNCEVLVGGEELASKRLSDGTVESISLNFTVNRDMTGKPMEFRVWKNGGFDLVIESLGLFRK